MQLIMPEILVDARELSLGALATALALGLVLWLLGWRGHRFWIVLTVTVGAGVFGLLSGPGYGTQPLVAGLLLALAAGTLALALVRVVVFAAGGTCAWALVHAVVPAWEEPLVCFLLGGLGGLLLFRFWTMALTSFAGALLLVYSGLCLADRLGKVDSIALSGQQTALLNGVTAGLALVGVLIQFFLERRRGRKKPKADRQDEGQDGRPRRPERDRYREDRESSAEDKKKWWDWAQRVTRRAG